MMPRKFPNTGPIARLALVLCLAAAAIGCGPARSSLKGTASFDGKPIEDGDIRLDPIEGTAGFGASTEIRGGAFEISEDQGLFEGTYYVAISASRKTGRMIKTEGIPGEATEVPESIQYIPEIYNAVSELRVTLGPGENTHPFELKPVRTPRP